MMKISELIEALSDCDPNATVVLAKDSEGNGFSTMGPGSLSYPMMYKDGEVGYPKLTPILEEMGYSDEDVMSDGEGCVVLWP